MIIWYKLRKKERLDGNYIFQELYKKTRLTELWKLERKEIGKSKIKQKTEEKKTVGHYKSDQTATLKS